MTWTVDGGLPPRISDGTFADKPQTPPTIGDLRADTPVDRITALIVDGCPDALSWSTSAVDCHNGFTFPGPIRVQFDGGELLATPHPLDDPEYTGPLAELTIAQGVREIFVDLRPAPVTELTPARRTRIAA